MSGPRVRRPFVLALASAALVATACDGGTAIEGALAPSGLSSSAPGGGSGGTTGLVGRSASELVGSWTRLSGTSAGVFTEVTFTFLAGGTGVRTTIARTALGAAVATEQANFRWEGGAGTLLLRFVRGPGLPDVLLRTNYGITAGLTGTTLRLDGQEYTRTGS